MRCAGSDDGIHKTCYSMSTDAKVAALVLDMKQWSVSMRD